MNKNKSINQLFAKEIGTRDRSNAIIKRTKISKKDLICEYELLNKYYNKLLKEIITLTKLGDDSQKQLIMTNEEIERQKDKLKEANDIIRSKTEELIESYNLLEEISRKDSLTKLLNRRALMEKIEYEIERIKRNRNKFSVIMADIDDFKKVNDRYGHDCGDLVLISLSKKITSELRKVDLVGRWGGDEFIILLPETNIQGVEIAAERLKEKITGEAFIYDNHDIYITVTFGVCEYNLSTDIKECIRKADKALYKGKKSGKNCVIAVK